MECRIQWCLKPHGVGLLLPLVWAERKRGSCVGEAGSHLEFGDCLSEPQGMINVFSMLPVTVKHSSTTSELWQLLFFSWPNKI